MHVFLATFVIFIGVFVLMSVGYWLQRRPVSGSCGGLAGVGIEKECDCPAPCEKRLAREAAQQAHRIEQERIL